jgi:Zn-dependent protease
MDILYKVSLWLVPVVYAVTFHEAAHSYVAKYFGDNTAVNQGRLGLNPIKHIDPVGSIIVPMLLLWIAGFVFGWAKPVPVQPKNFTNPIKHFRLVLLAGPLANLLMAVFWVLVMKIGSWLPSEFISIGNILLHVGAAGVFINTALMMFNLLPIPPLDGGRFLTTFLPLRYVEYLNKVESWSLLILVILLVSGLLKSLLWSMMVYGMSMVAHVANLPVDVFISSLKVLFN